MHCTKCNKSSDGKFCPDCGTKLGNLKKCMMCHEQLQAGHLFCGKCGGKGEPGDTEEKSVVVEQAGPSRISSHSDFETEKRINTAIKALKRRYSKGDNDVKICFVMVGTEKKSARSSKLFLSVESNSTCNEWKKMIVDQLKITDDCVMKFYSEKIYEDEHKAENVTDVVMKARSKKRKENLCYVLTNLKKSQLQAKLLNQKRVEKKTTEKEDGVVDLTKDDGGIEVEGAEESNFAEDKKEKDSEELPELQGLRKVEGAEESNFAEDKKEKDSEELPELQGLRKMKDVDDNGDDDGGEFPESPTLRKVMGAEGRNSEYKEYDEDLPDIPNLRKRRRELKTDEKNIVDKEEKVWAEVGQMDTEEDDQDDEMEDNSLEMQLYIQRQNRLQERKVMAMERLNQNSCQQGENVIVVFYENRQRKGYAIQITQSDTVQDLYDKICICIPPEELAPKFYLQTDEGEKIDLSWGGKVNSLTKVRLIEEEYTANDTITNLEEVVFDSP